MLDYTSCCSFFLNTDHQGSIVTLTQGGGGVPFAINRYDEWGIPAATNIGRFQYTGQAWIPELKMYYYKARMYIPGLGRFAQTDPIGYDDQVNLYAYVGNDPVNGVDPTGMACGTLIEGKIGSNCSGETIVGLMTGNYPEFGKNNESGQSTAGKMAEGIRKAEQVGGDGEAGAQLAASLLEAADRAASANDMGQTTTEIVTAVFIGTVIITPDSKDFKPGSPLRGAAIRDERGRIFVRDKDVHRGSDWKMWRNIREYQKGGKQFSVANDGRIVKTKTDEIGRGVRGRRK